MSKQVPLKLFDLLKKLEAAEQRSSPNWISSKRYSTLQVYSPSLGILRKIVEVAEPYGKEFSDYIAACSPGNVRKLINIARAACELKSHTSSVCPPGKAGDPEYSHWYQQRTRDLGDVLLAALEGVEF